ncbi:HAD family hydrolase [Rhodovibrio salinarum]|uniref:phosphoglycolate phosphatase n=1 Tax=Rhodovibrio salinarum TaxID=1087 RepID=A0A934QJ77_9PROT|nr:HAD family hydrolase [Rhodovibrio salinarum]MBK1697864.1 HAD family hydrolase [Rhodovibrio salinarum]
MSDAARPRGLLFDWDNTLVDSWAAIHHALRVTFEALGHRPWSFEETKANVRKSAREAFPELFGAEAARATEIFYDTFAQDHLESLTPLPGAHDLIVGLAQEGYAVGVISNKQGQLLRAEAAALGWDRHLMAVVGANDAVRDKPDPAVVDYTLAGGPMADVERGRLWFVGDTDIDLACAHNGGCVPVLLRETPPAAGEFEGCAPAQHFPNCGALLAYLRAH